MTGPKHRLTPPLFPSPLLPVLRPASEGHPHPHAPSKHASGIPKLLAKKGKGRQVHDEGALASSRPPGQRRSAARVAAAVHDVAAAAASAAAEVVDGAAGGRCRGRGGRTVLRAPLTAAFRFDISSKDHGHCHPKKSGFPDWSSRDEIRAKDPEARDA